jgi:hypothetical protein
MTLNNISNDLRFFINLQEDDDEILNEKIVKLLNPSTPLIESLGKCMHILDVFRKSLIQLGPSHQTRMPKATKRNWLTLEAGEEIIRSAVELHEAGIRFKKSKTWSLKDVSFDRGVLRLPTLVVDDTTEYMLLNLIALERLLVGAGNLLKLNHLLLRNLYIYNFSDRRTKHNSFRLK